MADEAPQAEVTELPETDEPELELAKVGTIIPCL